MNRAAPPSSPPRPAADHRISGRSRLVLLATVLLLGATPALAPAEGFSGGGYVQPYPAQWPRLIGMSARCTELRGQYLDPIPVDRAGAPPREGGRYGAWAAFGMARHTVGADDPTIAIRQFTLDVRADGSLNVRYIADGNEVAVRSFAAGDLTCGSDGLAFTAFDRRQLLPPRHAIRGPDLVRSTLYRVGGHLNVRTDATTRMRWFGVLPLSSTVVSWERFAVE